MNGENKNGFGMRIWNRLKYSLGFYRNPEYVENRLRDADVNSALFLAVVVSCVEIWMLIRYTVKYGAMCETIGEFLQYTYAYWILLGSAVFLFIYCRLYNSGRLKRGRKYSIIFILSFFLIGMYFGGVTAQSDFARGRMITCFLTMMMYVTVIVIKRPFISLLLTLVPAYTFAYILNHYTFDKTGAQVILSSGDTINYITFVIILVVLEFSVYFQRYHEAVDAYKLEKAAITDDLTGIHNIHKFDMDARQYLSDSLEQGKYPMYLLIDIENFQTFNDHFDHQGGDKLLTEIGKMLVEAFPDEPVARKSIDDFVVLTNADDYMERLARLREKLRSAYPLEKYLNIKAGAYRAKDPSENPRHALDHANYALKHIHNNEQVFLCEYDEKMGKEYSLKQYVLNNLEKAINEGYIKVYYQPVVWAKTGKLSGCEALVRWIDPDMGFMNPGVFIPTLEDGRQIHKLDLCVYEMVCKRIRDCIDQGLPVLPTSLNFSRLDFELMDAVGELEKLVQKYQIPRKYLHVEITESAATKDVDDLKKAMGRLHELGYTIWLDDFGSGYSSMNVLKDFDFDVIKIDMEFLRNFHEKPQSRTIISSVINMADSLHMRTLCEGVETEEAIEFLKEAGCERLQGYYYSKPLPYEEILKKIQEGIFELE